MVYPFLAREAAPFLLCRSYYMYIYFFLFNIWKSCELMRIQDKIFKISQGTFIL